jgi:ferredoxin
LYCQKICPVQSFSGDKNISYAQVDQIACTQNEKRLQIAYCEPCGACIKVCPVGEDRQLFQSNNFQKYFDEQKILFENPHAEEYRDWIHMRSHGSYPLEGRTSKNSSR